MAKKVDENKKREKNSLDKLIGTNDHLEKLN